MHDHLQIFISYSWHDKDTVDQIDRDMQSMGIILMRDIRDLKYKDSILEFMKKIRSSDYVLLIVSDTFLRSRNCMFEIQELIKDENYRERILPIVLDRTDIFSSEGRLRYIRYWEQELKRLEALIKMSDLKNVGPAINDLRIVNQICASTGDFISVLSDMKHIPFSELNRNGYREILEIVGIPDVSLLERLREIEAIEDQEEQDLQIEQFLKSRPKHILGNMIKGMLEAKRGNYKKARYTYETAIADLTDAGYKEPSVMFQAILVLNLLSMLYSNHFNEHDKAITSVSRAIELVPNFAFSYFVRGDRFMEKKQYDNAIADYTRALDLQPDYGKVYHQRAVAYLEKGDFSKGVEDFTKAIELEPGIAAGYAGRGDAYRCLKEYDMATEEYSRAIALEPHNIAFSLKRAITFMDKNDYDSAIKDFTRIIEMNPRCANAFHNRAVAYKGKKEFDKMTADLTKSAELGHAGDANLLREIQLFLKKSSADGNIQP